MPRNRAGLPAEWIAMAEPSRKADRARARLRRRRDVLSEMLPRVQGDDLARDEALVREMIETSLKLLRDGTSIGDLKILNAELRELRYAFKVFAPYRQVRKVSCFGSARLPSTAKGRAIALTVAVALVLLVGGLFFVSSKTVNSEEVRKLAKADIEAFEKIPENDYKKRLAKADEILSNENYLKYAKGDISLAARLRPNLKQQVDLETRGESVVKPFLEKVRLLKEGPPEEYKKEWMGLYETAQAHLLSFERTAMGPPLIAVRDELKGLLENVGPSWREEISKLIREVTKLIDAKNFSQGLREVNDFGSRYGENDSNVMKGMLQGERERLRSKAKSWVDDLKGEAAKKTTKEDARRVLETARAFIKGFPEVEKSLDGYLSAYK